MTKEEKRAYWQQRVEAWQAGGLSMSAYCAQEGLALSALHYWRKRFAEDDVAHVENGTNRGFLPVTVTPMPASSAPVEVQLLSGRSLKFSAPVDAEWLHTLVHVLERPCG
jgi:transposase-like protein